MIQFFKFPSAFDMRDVSPFVLKLETYMRLAGVTYNTNEMADPRKAPKGKLPFIKDGVDAIADSEFCIKYLKDKYGDPLGKDLSAEQHAFGHAMCVMFENRTILVLVYSRWVMPEHFPHIVDAFFGAIPKFIRGFVTKKIRKTQIDFLDAQGIGRHTQDEIFALGVSDVKAFEGALGDKDYLFGDNPSEYDATAYGFLANLITKPFITPVSDYIENSKPLMAYLERIEMKAFG
ncbi:MAG: glutathione S-transferase [Robiginitomaculum sp.]|nr:MAG: glutathione S-transferase [Robiginitomaculum sp.]